MKRIIGLVGIAATLGSSTLAFGQKRGKEPSCSQIMAMCMKRAGRTHAGICEDMFHHAKHNGFWQATIEPNGVKHPEVPCTP